MATVFITTIVGKDKPYLVKSIAELTRTIGGEWTQSKVVKMDDQFAAMMKVVIDESREQELKDRLNKTFPELNFFHSPAKTYIGDEFETVTLVVDCKDRPGLTHDITKVLSDLSLEAEDMEFHRLPVAPVGGTVYTAKVTVKIPDSMEKSRLAEAIENVSECSRVYFE